MAPETLSAVAARRIILAAQGFASARPKRVTERQVLSLIRHLGLIQIDSVNVLSRAHYVPIFSRLGAYDRALLDRAAWGDGTGSTPARSLIEYWGHEASLVPIETWPLLRWRMAAAKAGSGVWGGIAAIARDQPDLVSRVRDLIAERGPLSAADLDIPEAAGRTGPWWGWNDAKRALEFLFWSGTVAAATRRKFERLYDLTERVVPAEILNAPELPRAEAQRALLLEAARALGVATEPDLRDYWRLRPDHSKPLVAELVESGALVPVKVEGWRHQAYLHQAAPTPHKVRARALLSPFDPLIWERARTERLWNFRYRIEIYTPAEKRVHGYYVLPFLLGEDLVARVDLKADRVAGRLLVQAAWIEAGADAGPVAVALNASLDELASWLGLGVVEIQNRGDLAPALAAERH